LAAKARLHEATEKAAARRLLHHDRLHELAFAG
jgi:hypothetical protein